MDGPIDILALEISPQWCNRRRVSGFDERVKCRWFLERCVHGRAWHVCAPLPPSSLPTTFAWLDLGTAGLFLGQLQDGLKAFNLEIIFCH